MLMTDAEPIIEDIDPALNYEEIYIGEDDGC